MGMLRFAQKATGCNVAGEKWGNTTLLERCWKEIKATAAKPEGRCFAKFVAWPVSPPAPCWDDRCGPMMSCGKGIGREGGRTGAREDRCGRGLALKDGEGGNLRDSQSRCFSLFKRCNPKCVRGMVLSSFISRIYKAESHFNWTK